MSEKHRRWYDLDPILSQSMQTLEHTDDESQIKIALNLIKIIIEHNITNSQFSEVEDIIQAVEDGKTPRGLDRWYDLDTTVRTAINMLQSCDPEMQHEVAKHMAKDVLQKIKSNDQGYFYYDSSDDDIENDDDDYSDLDSFFLGESDVKSLKKLFEE